MTLLRWERSLLVGFFRDRQTLFRYNERVWFWATRRWARRRFDQVRTKGTGTFFGRQAYPKRNVNGAEK